MALTNEDPTLEELESATATERAGVEEEAGAEADSDDEAGGSDAGGDGAGDGTDGSGEKEKDKSAATGEHEIVLAGEEKPQAHRPAPPWLKQLRTQNRERASRIEELERKLTEVQGPAVRDPGPKPTMDSCDFDAGVYEKKLDEWKSAQQTKANAEAQAARAQEAAQTAWKARVDVYDTHKTELAKQITGYAEAEATTQGALNPYQQGIIVKAGSAGPLIVAYLGRNPAALQELAALTDLTDFTYKVADLKAKLKMQKKGSSIPPPERPAPRGSGGISSGSGSGDAHLEKLRAQAAKTGDMTPVTNYQRELKRKQSK